MDTFTGEWKFEAADPEVGFLTDFIYHDCERNEDGEAAHQESSMQTVTRRRTDGLTEQVVAESILFTCPACGATTAAVEHWPTWMFEEPRD